MKKFTVAEINSWKPCYDATKWLTADWEGTAIDILKMDNIPFADRLWCVLRTELVSERLMRLFAVWSYRQTLKFLDPDPRSIEGANVAERFANNEASKEELSAAESAAWSAAESAAWSAARSAAWSAAESAARSAARSAAWSARSAAWSAARSAAESAAWSAAESAQRDKLIEMIEKENT